MKHLIVFSTQHAQAVDEATKEVAGDTSKKHKKKRNRKSETEHHMPSPDEVQFVEVRKIATLLRRVYNMHTKLKLLLLNFVLPPFMACSFLPRFKIATMLKSMTHPLPRNTSVE